MTHIDGTAGGFRTRLDAEHTAMVDTIAVLGGDDSRTAAVHRIVAEHHAGLMRASGRSADELARLAKYSTAAASSPAGAVDGGQGATRPPAPTIDTHRWPTAHVHLDGGSCVFGDRCGR